MINESEFFKLRYKNRIDAVLLCLIEINNISDKKQRKNELTKRLKDVQQSNPINKNYIIKELHNQGIDYTQSKRQFDIKYPKYDEYYKSYYSTERSHFFSDSQELINWFTKQNNSCGYCRVTKVELSEIVLIRGGTLTLNQGTKRSKGTLEIERLKPSDENNDNFGYTYDNCILSCPLCNNAKSNLIDEDGWKKFFIKPMREYYESILNKKLLIEESINKCV